MITAPGVYDLRLEYYLSDPVPFGSLRSTEARLLIPPGCPAAYKWHREHNDEARSTAAFDCGRAAHLLVLGKGNPLVEVNAKDWKTIAARDKREEAYADGMTPLLSRDFDRVHEMAEALRRHPLIPPLLSKGAPERTLIWRDEETGIWCRARLDWLPDPDHGRPRLLVPEYKTTLSADADAISRTVGNYGYHRQAAWYEAGVIALGLHGAVEPAIIFIFQEKTPPYLTRVVQLDATAMRYGRMANRRAIHVYRRCRETGIWPGYELQVTEIALPRWQEINEQESWESGDYDVEIMEGIE